MSDLIERLQAEKEVCKRESIWHSSGLSPNMDLSRAYSEFAHLFDEAIIALSAPLPEEVRQAIEYWRHKKGSANNAAVADLIERLARDNQGLHSTNSQMAVEATANLKEMRELKQRIEELEAQISMMNWPKERAELAERQRDEFIEFVEGALGCTDGEDIRAHIEPEIQRIRGMK